MFNIIWMLIIGLIVGALAKLIMPGRDPGGIFVTMLLGIATAHWWVALSAGRSVSINPGKGRDLSSRR